MKYIIGFVGLLAIGFFLFSRFTPEGTAVNKRPYSISYILDNSDDLDGKVILVKGSVKGKAGILGTGGYILEDRKNEILILSSKGIPKVGDKLVVSGKFQQTYETNDKDHAIIIEQSRK